MKKVIPLLLTMLVLLAACSQNSTDSSPAASGAPSVSALPSGANTAPPILDYKTGDGKVDIIDKADNNKALQSIDFEKDQLTPQNSDYFVVLVDMNFDGYTDVRVLQSQGVQNIYYDAWLFDPATRKFVKNDELSELGDAGFNVSDKTVTSFESLSATDKLDRTFTFENGKLVEKTRIEQKFDSEKNEIVISTYERDASGEMKLKDEKREPASDAPESAAPSEQPSAAPAPEGEKPEGLENTAYREALKGYGLGDSDIDAFSWSNDTFFGEEFYGAYQSEIPSFLVSKVSGKAYRCVESPFPVTEPAIYMYEIYPNNSEGKLEKAERGLTMVEFGSENSPATYEDFDKDLSEIFTPEFKDELMVSVRNIYQPDENGKLQRVADRGADILLANCKLDVVESTADKLALKLTVEYNKDVDSNVVGETKSYNYTALIINGEELFEKCELFY